MFWKIKALVLLKNIIAATSGNRTRAARVAGEHSTTEPTLLAQKLMCIFAALTLETSLFGMWNEKSFAVGRIRTYAPRGNLISSQTP